MSRRHVAMLIALAAIWGASFLFIKVAVRDVHPLALVWLRLLLAAAVLVPVALIVLGRRAATAGVRAAAGRLTLLGVVNSALPFALISWAETDIDSGLTAILQAAAPLFTVLLVAAAGEERVTGARLGGFLTGFVGVAVLVGGDLGGHLLAALAVVASAACYAAGGVFAARGLRRVDPLVLAAGSMVGGALVTAPLGIVTLPESLPDWKELASVAVLGVVCTGVAYLLYFAVLRGAGPSRAILVTYLVPAVAVAYGVLLLGEPLRTGAIVGLALILGGVALAGRASARVARPARV
jgi:drug/metabolite transporter (DMT)-like permease